MKPYFFSVPTFTCFQKTYFCYLTSLKWINWTHRNQYLGCSSHATSYQAVLEGCLAARWKVHEDVRLEVRLKFYKSPNFWGCKFLLILEVVHDHFHLKSRIWIWYSFETFVSFRQDSDSWCSKLSQLQLNRVAACCSDQWYPKQIQILKTDKIQPLINLPGTPKKTRVRLRKCHPKNTSFNTSVSSQMFSFQPQNGHPPICFANQIRRLLFFSFPQKCDKGIVEHLGWSTREIKGHPLQMNSRPQKVGRTVFLQHATGAIWATRYQVTIYTTGVPTKSFKNSSKDSHCQRVKGVFQRMISPSWNCPKSFGSSSRMSRIRKRKTSL